MEKTTMTDSTIAFIGLGLIGGSIARAIRKTRPDIRIMAYMRSRSRLEQARKEGIVDVILDGIDENLRECDLIFLCTPVEYNAGYLSAIRPYLKQGALITDVGSTKCGIHEEIRRQGLEYCFVGGHPMAGSEKTGYENSTDHLLENAYYIVTPPEGKNSSRPQALSLNAERIVAVAKTIGAIPLVLDYREHDKVVAAISHLPHLVASSLVNLIKDHDTADGTMKQVAAGGFKDITRIASSSPEMWEQICMTNVAPISDILEAYIASLNKVLEEIKEHKGQDIYDFPRAMIKEDNLEFSFSGLKSAFINLHHNAQQKGESLSNADLSASFQAAVLDILMAKTKKALEKYPVKTLVVAGGVAANQGLRERLASEITDVKVIIPPLRLCGDNAGMIAYASVSEWNKENFAGWDLNAKPSLAFEGIE